MWKLRFQPDGVPHPLEVELEAIDTSCPDEFVARIGNARHEVQFVRRGEHGGLLRIHGRVTPFYAVCTATGFDVWTRGRTYQLRKVERAAARRATTTAGAVAQEEIKAPMPGTILKINVGIGEPFEPHAPLIVMESMKMEMALSAPHAGRVREILCKVGELVPMGQVLARLEQETANAAAAGQDR